MDESTDKLEAVKITDFGLSRDLVDGCIQIAPTTDGTRYLTCHTCIMPFSLTAPFDSRQPWPTVPLPSLLPTNLSCKIECLVQSVEVSEALAQQFGEEPAFMHFIMNFNCYPCQSCTFSALKLGVSLPALSVPPTVASYHALHACGFLGQLAMLTYTCTSVNSLMTSKSPVPRTITCHAPILLALMSLLWV